MKQLYPIGDFSILAVQNHRLEMGSLTFTGLVCQFAVKKCFECISPHKPAV